VRERVNFVMATASSNAVQRQSRLLRADELPALVSRGEVPSKFEFSTLCDEDRIRHSLVFPSEVGRSFSPRSAGAMNRYGNIVPYDRNRVALSDKVSGCDYVNASWISKDDTRDESGKFIAAQGRALYQPITWLNHFRPLIQALCRTRCRISCRCCSKTPFK